LICLPFSAFLLIRAKNKNEKIFWALAFTIQIAAILLTFSRAGILGILLFVLGWLFLHKKLPWIVGFLSLGLLLTASLLYLRQNPQQSSPEERLRIITKGIMAFEKRPIFGWGWANFDYAFESVSWPIKFQHDVYVDKAHSTILEILTATGLGGLAIYLTIVGRLAKQLWQKKSKVLFLTLLLFLFHSQTNVISIAEELIFWLILGIGSTEEPP
jgi:O-antigen ligase